MNKPGSDGSVGHKFSHELEDWLEHEGGKTLGDLSHAFGEKSFAVLFMLLMFIPALPIPTAGLTHVLELITMLLALEMIAGHRKIWLPERWRTIRATRIFPKRVIRLIIKQIRFLERFSKPRLSGLLQGGLILRGLGVLVFIFTLSAFVAPPLTGLDTLPSMGVVLIALSIILGDVLILLAGVLVGSLGVVVMIGLATMLINLVSRLLH